MCRNPKKILVLIVLAAFLVTACESLGTKTTVGAAGGAAAGGLIGAAAGGGGTGIAAGAILGGLLGGVIGNRLDAADRRYADEAAYRAFENAPVGSSTTWRNPDTGRYGTITPTRTYRGAEGAPCREYEQTVYIDGERELVRGTACRQSDGRWRVVS